MPEPSDRELMALQLDALFTYDGYGRMRVTNEPAARPAPRFFLGRTGEGNLWRVRHDLPGSLAQALHAIAAAEPVTGDFGVPPAGRARVRALLARHAPIEDEGMGPAFSVPEGPRPVAGTVALTRANVELARTSFPWLLDEREFEAARPCFGVVVNGVVVSVCFSSRRSKQAAEAGVNTLEAFRGRGYAAATVAAWAGAVRGEGLIPLYSTSWDNAASRGVARRLGLRLYGADYGVR